MNRTIISQRITSILSEIDRLNSALYAMNSTDIQRYPDNYEVLSTDAALRAEGITCRLRHLIYATTAIKKSDYLCSASTMQGVGIREDEGVLEITLPCLLPKRKQRQSTEFLIDPFYAALEGYSRQNALPRFSHCVVCFAHIYCQDLPERRVREYHNKEQKKHKDVITTIMLEDQKGLQCDAKKNTELGEADCTHIFIMDSDQFPRWLESHQNSLKTISDFP